MFLGDQELDILIMMAHSLDQFVVYHIQFAQVDVQYLLEDRSMFCEFIPEYFIIQYLAQEHIDVWLLVGRDVVSKVAGDLEQNSLDQAEFSIENSHVVVEGEEEGDLSVVERVQSPEHLLVEEGGVFDDHTDVHDAVEVPVLHQGVDLLATLLVLHQESVLLLQEHDHQLHSTLPLCLYLQVLLDQLQTPLLQEVVHYGVFLVLGHH